MVETSVLEATRPVLLFDYFRVPYRVEPGGDSGVTEVRAAGGGRALRWPAELPDGPPAEVRLGSIPLFARLATEPPAGGGWSPVRPLEGADGGAAAHLWRHEDGSVFLPFDPDEAIRSYWSESYHLAARSGLARGAKRLALRTYYRVRPALPRAGQIALRRAFSRVQARTRFPRWPVETALHDLYDLLLGLAAGVAGEPIPRLAPWPAGRSWALVLTHDVETALGRDNVHLMRELEERAGYRSSWNFVPRRYEVDDALVRDLREAGFEVGVHGLYHDGRDLESRRVLEERLPEMRAYAERWGAAGFRSPATHRVWELMPLLGFDYDSSYPDTDPFEPQSGGCCSWLPFFNRELVELPITLPQDHTLFVILGRDEAAWIEKAEFLRGRGGMALVITHPDYMLDERRLGAYERFLARFAGDEEAWRALPREVSAWWRRRADSSLERGPDGWRVVGPAADEAAVELVEPRSTI
jgi:hypothetical protein